MVHESLVHCHHFRMHYAAGEVCAAGKRYGYGVPYGIRPIHSVSIANAKANSFIVSFLPRRCCHNAIDVIPQWDLYALLQFDAPFTYLWIFASFACLTLCCHSFFTEAKATTKPNKNDDINCFKHPPYPHAPAHAAKRATNNEQQTDNKKGLPRRWIWRIIWCMRWMWCM